VDDNGYPFIYAMPSAFLSSSCTTPCSHMKRNVISWCCRGLGNKMWNLDVLAGGLRIANGEPDFGPHSRMVRAAACACPPTSSLQKVDVKAGRRNVLSELEKAWYGKCRKPNHLNPQDPHHMIPVSR